MRLFGLWVRLWIWSHGGRRMRVDAAGYDMVVHCIGPHDAEPWLLLHGMGATALSWTCLIKALRTECRLYVPELCALGGTRGPDPAVQVAESASVLAALIRTLAPGPGLTVAGMSLGGWMAVRLALAHPDAVDRLLLIDVAGWRDQDWQRVVDLVRLRDLGDVDRLYTALFDRTPWLLRHSRNAFLAAYRSASVTSILEKTRAEDSFDATDLARIRVPTGIIWAEHDGLFPVDVARSMRQALPLANLRIIPRCGHGLHWERPRALVAAVRQWRRETESLMQGLEPAAGRRILSPNSREEVGP